MRILLTVLFAAVAPFALAQADLWKQASPEPNLPELNETQLSGNRLQAVHKLLRANVATMGWECEGDEGFSELVQGLSFRSIPLAEKQETVLMEAGAGCARSAQGSNGGMWVVSFDGDTPVLIAGPKDGFNGWLYSIELATSHGYHDLILGWHMSASTGNLNYFRYDGKSYQGVGSATYTIDDDDKWHIVANGK